MKVVIAKVPFSELFGLSAVALAKAGFTTRLRFLTEGRGVPNLEFSHYAIVPRNACPVAPPEADGTGVQEEP